jgi:hypothetical protein
VWIEWAGQDRNRVAAKVGNALCIGAKVARTLLDEGRPVRVWANVHEVRRLHGLFAGLGLGIRVEPAFPWGWEPSPAELGVLHLDRALASGSETITDEPAPHRDETRGRGSGNS